MTVRRINILTEPEKLQCRKRSEMAVNGIDVLLGNLRLIIDKGDITEKYRTIAQDSGIYAGLVRNFCKITMWIRASIGPGDDDLTMPGMLV